MDLSTRQGRREQGLLIQKAVERAGLSVEELANRIGCSRALIYQYLSGTTLAQPDRLQQIAAETGVPLAYFYGGALSEEGRRGGRAAEREDPRARLTERIHQLEELAQAQEGPPDWEALASTCERIITLASQADDMATEARALLRLGKARIHRGDFSRAAVSLSRAAALFASLHDARGETDARQALGHALLATGRTAEAREEFQRVARSDLWAARWTGAVSLAAVAEQLGDYRRAMELCDEAASILEEARNPQDAAHGTLYVNANRVNLYLACGDFRSAEPLIKRCMQDAEALGNSDQHLEARLNMGVCGLWQGRWAAAEQTLSAALHLARFVGDQSRETMIRAVLALLHASLGDYDFATQQAKDALASALSQGDRRAELFAQIALTEAYTGALRDSEARYHANQAIAVAAALRLSLYEADSRLRLARLGLRTEDFAEVEENVERALLSAQRLGARHLEATAHLRRGDLAFRSGDLAAAQSHTQKARELAEELGLIPLRWEVEALTARIAAAVSPPRTEEARAASARAVALLDSVRTELINEGIPDTILEDKERQDIYLLHYQQLIEQGRTEEASAFVEQAGWPPLTARLQGMNTP